MVAQLGTPSSGQGFVERQHSGTPWTHPARCWKCLIACLRDLCGGQQGLASPQHVILPMLQARLHWLDQSVASRTKACCAWLAAAGQMPTKASLLAGYKAVTKGSCACYNRMAGSLGVATGASVHDGLHTTGCLPPSRGRHRCRSSPQGEMTSAHQTNPTTARLKHRTAFGPVFVHAASPTPEAGLLITDVSRIMLKGGGEGPRGVLWEAWLCQLSKAASDCCTRPWLSCSLACPPCLPWLAML